jgi:hypothetical protein
MHIIIGPTPPVDSPGMRSQVTTSGAIEARILEVRAPRERPGRPPSGQKERRTKRNTPDPKGGRVMVLLVPEGLRIPKDIESGNYRILLRFVPGARQL